VSSTIRANFDKVMFGVDARCGLILMDQTRFRRRR